MGAFSNVTAPFGLLRPVEVDPFRSAAEFGNLQALSQMRALREQQMAAQQQQMQLQGVALQKAQYDLARTKAINEAYMGAFTPDPNGVPQIDQAKLGEALRQHGYGEAIPEVMEGVTKYKQGQANLIEANTKVKALQTDHDGEI